MNVVFKLIHAGNIHRFTVTEETNYDAYATAAANIAGTPKEQLVGTWTDGETEALIVDEETFSRAVATSREQGFALRITLSEKNDNLDVKNAVGRCTDCEKTIDGYPRFKCVVCRNVTLCAPCHGKDTHPQEHMLLVIRAPIKCPLFEVNEPEFGTHHSRRLVRRFVKGLLFEEAGKGGKGGKGGAGWGKGWGKGLGKGKGDVFVAVEAPLDGMGKGGFTGGKGGFMMGKGKGKGVHRDFMHRPFMGKGKGAHTHHHHCWNKHEETHQPGVESAPVHSSDDSETDPVIDRKAERLEWKIARVTSKLESHDLKEHVKVRLAQKLQILEARQRDNKKDHATTTQPHDSSPDSDDGQHEPPAASGEDRRKANLARRAEVLERKIAHVTAKVEAPDGKAAKPQLIAKLHALETRLAIVKSLQD